MREPPRFLDVTAPSHPPREGSSPSYLLLKKGWSTAMGGLSAALGSRPAVVHAATTVIRCRL